MQELEEKYMKVLEQAIEKYGKEPQVYQTVEEMSELTKELIKNVNRGKSNIEEIAEETADTMIMLMQIVMIYGKEDTDFGNKVGEYIIEKINRLKKSMEV